MSVRSGGAPCRRVRPAVPTGGCRCAAVAGRVAGFGQGSQPVDVGAQRWRPVSTGSAGVARRARGPVTSFGPHTETLRSGAISEVGAPPMAEIIVHATP